MILSGKVRLLGLSSVREAAPIPTEQDLSDMERFHWQALDRTFDELRQYPNPFLPLRAFIQPIQPFFGVPFPERPLLARGSPLLFRLFTYYVASNAMSICFPAFPSQSLRPTHRSRFSSVHISAEGSESDEDQPYRASHSHGRLCDTFHPYIRLFSSRRVLKNSVGDQTLETGSGGL